MDQGRDRCRTFHGIGQPNVQGEHRTLTGTTDKHHEEGHRQNPVASVETGRKLRHRIQVEAERSHIVAVEQDTDEEEQVGETCHDESLLRSGNGSMQRIIETDEQVGAHTHQLPEQIHLEDVGGYDQTQHRHGEKTQEGIVTLESFLTMHITERIDVHHQTHRRDDDEHHHRNRCQTEAQGEHQL